MSIRARVQDYVVRALRNPQVGSSPTELKALAKDAHDTYDDSFYSLNAPASPLTWEIKNVMLGANAQSDRKVFRCPFRVEIVGFRPIVVIPVAQQGGAGVTVPGVDDIDVSIDLNGERFFTSAAGINTIGATQDGTFVTLGSIGVQTPRLWRMQPDHMSPDLGFTFRWKQPAGTYKDAQICVSIFAKKASDPQ